MTRRALIRPSVVLEDPDAAVAVLHSAVWGLAIRAAYREPDFVVFEVTYSPLPPVAVEGYPQEVVRISVWRNGRVLAVPVGPQERTWKHRNPMSVDVYCGLCLWYDDDPRALRWEWNDGLEQYIAIVQRHMLSEEWARRHNGRWPVEDAPHGRPDSPHPIRTREMANAARRRR